MRVVLDTTILVGALITKVTPPDRVYRAWLRGEIELVTSAAQLAAVDLSPDPKDNPILAAAIAGDVDLIVSGDKTHMLSLREVHHIPIVTAREALDRL